MIDINVGFIGEDVVALCDDTEAHYALHAKKTKDGYEVTVSSSHGVLSTGMFEAKIGTRQMIYYAMAKHLESVEEAHKILADGEEDKESNKGGGHSSQPTTH